jgi:surfeit locus 1 family protein
MANALIQRIRRYHFDWKLTLLTALLLPLMISLGFWQLRREDEKLALQTAYDARQREAPVALSTLDITQDQQYRQVSLRGRYDNAHNFLLDNRIYQGQVGYEVIVPFETADGTVVLVNRGWMAQGRTRQELPAIPAVEEEVSIDGSVYQPVGASLVLGDALESEGWPKVIQTLAPLRLAELSGTGDASKVFPYTVRLAAAAPGVLTRYWPVISTTPEKHRGYAVQWFAMATALAGLYFYYSTKEHTQRS